MPITATAGQNLAQPVRTGQGSLTGVTGILVQGNSVGAMITSAVSEAVYVTVQPSGTLTNDCSLQIQVASNGSSFGCARLVTNAELTLTDGSGATAYVGWSGKVDVPIGATVRARFVSGTTASPNGATVRWTN